MKISFKKEIKIEFASFDTLAYASIESVENEESLFEKACFELGIKELYSKQMAYMQAKNKSLVFLKDFKASKNPFIYPEPLKFLAFFGTKTHFNNLCFIHIKAHYSYLAFYEDKNLVFCKNIPKFCLNFLHDKTNKNELFEEFIIKQGRLDELCKNYKSEALALFVEAKESDFSSILSQRGFNAFSIKRQDLKDQNLFYKQEHANFQRHLKNKDTSLILKLLACVFISFILAFAYVSFQAYEAFKNYELLQSKEFDFKNTLKELELKENELSKELENLSSQNELQSLHLQKENQRMKNLEDNLYLKSSINFLYTLTKELNLHKITITSLKLEQNSLSIQAKQSLNLQNFITKLENHNLAFYLKNKELKEGFYTLTLEENNEK